MPLALNRKPKVGPVRKGEKVVAAVDLPGVPEGTTGKVKLVNGLFRNLSWLRYWVFFDNGVDLGSIDHRKLVRATEWESFKVERARLAELGAQAAAEEAAKAAAKAAAGADAPAAAPASKVPEHLLARAKKRKEALGQG